MTTAHRRKQQRSEPLYTFARDTRYVVELRDGTKHQRSDYQGWSRDEHSGEIEHRFGFHRRDRVVISDSEIASKME